MYNEGDLELLKEMILLPIVLTVLERDKTAINTSEIKMKQPYLTVLNIAMDRVTKELSSIRGELNRRNLKIYQCERLEHSLRTPFVCRGKRDVFEMSWELIQAEVQIRIVKYITGKGE